MLRCCAASSLAILLSFSVHAQSAGPQESVSSSGVTLNATTQLVVVDVVVTDHGGHPVKGLKLSDFRLDEGKQQQTIKTFEEHTSLDPATAKPARTLALPPGYFSDYSPVPEGMSLNVLLLDRLNTEMKDQAYFLNQLKKYVKRTPPGTRIAIFGLNGGLSILQGFTSDPALLRDAIEHKTNPGASLLLDDAAGTGSGTAALTEGMAEGGAPPDLIASVAQFEAVASAYQLQNRIQLTIDSFAAISRYLAQFPGRKNLLWFSGSFPLTVFPDRSLENPFDVVSDYTFQLRAVALQMSKARIAVYPIDARGLITDNSFAANSDRSDSGPNPAAFVKSILDFGTLTTQTHFSMDKISDDTGGRSFYNTNGLTDAVAQAIEDGANFYTIAYSPSDRNFRGDFRSIKVHLQGSWATQDLNLSYRRGYYTDDTRKVLPKPDVAHANPAVISPPPTRGGVATSAMLRGAPTLSEIIFKARVLPDSDTSTPNLAPDNTAADTTKGPYRTYDIDLSGFASNIELKPGLDGELHGVVELVTYVYDADGKTLVVAKNASKMSVKPEAYKAFQHAGFSFHQQVSAPIGKEAFLRIAVHDLNSDHIGVIEVPTSAVSHLPSPPPVATNPAK